VLILALKKESIVENKNLKNKLKFFKKSILQSTVTRERMPLLVSFNVNIAHSP
jgi:hypothetical protein